MLDTQAEIRRYLRISLAAIFLLGGTATAWSVLASLDSAVVTQGTVQVEHNDKKVQHPTGGVVGAIFVREGQRVKEGDLVVRLDETATRAALGIIVNELTATRARAARLSAERLGLKRIDFPMDVLARAETEREIEQLIDGEVRVFLSRQKLQEGQKAQLNERIGQLSQDVQGLREQQKSLVIQLEVARNELADLRGLEERKLVPRPRVTNLEREVARNQGALGEIIARIASSQGRIMETTLQIVQLDNDHIAEVSREIREAESKINELQERRVAAEDQLRRVEIRAPVSGVVHQLSVHTVGGVVTPSEPLMLIIPEADRLILEVRIQPHDIDQVHVGQLARVRFTAFNQRTTPEIDGRLFRIGGDLTKEAQTGQSYYSAGVAISEEELRKLNGLKLMPGMPADAFIKTGERTFASYLVKPLTDQMNRSLRER